MSENVAMWELEPGNVIEVAGLMARVTGILNPEKESITLRLSLPVPYSTITYPRYTRFDRAEI